MTKVEKMQILNPHAAGIDIGSKSHFLAVGQCPEDIREFGVYSSDHEKLISYLKDNNVNTVAMERTGSYWQGLFMAIQQAGIEVILVSGHQAKNVREKTDVQDCQWIQKLHSLGLLRGCFLPNEQTAKLRILHRHRASLIEAAKINNLDAKSTSTTLRNKSRIKTRSGPNSYRKLEIEDLKSGHSSTASKYYSGKLVLFISTSQQKSP